MTSDFISSTPPLNVPTRIVTVNGKRAGYITRRGWEFEVECARDVLKNINECVEKSEHYLKNLRSTKFSIFTILPISILIFLTLGIFSGSEISYVYSGTLTIILLYFTWDILTEEKTVREVLQDSIVFRGEVEQTIREFETWIYSDIQKD